MEDNDITEKSAELNVRLPDEAGILALCYLCVVKLCCALWLIINSPNILIE